MIKTIKFQIKNQSQYSIQSLRYSLTVRQKLVHIKLKARYYDRRMFIVLSAQKIHSRCVVIVTANTFTNCTGEWYIELRALSLSVYKLSHRISIEQKLIYIIYSPYHHIYFESIAYSKASFFLSILSNISCPTFPPTSYDNIPVEHQPTLKTNERVNIKLNVNIVNELNKH